MPRIVIVVVLLFALPLVQAAPPPKSAGLEDWPTVDRQRQIKFESVLLDTVDPARLRKWHDALASEPHDAGSPGDQRVAEFVATAFEEMGLEVERHAFWAYLARPITAHVELVEPEAMVLPVREGAVEGDPWSARAGLNPGWNAYSGTGDVTGEVVYANYGTREDFAELKRLGIDCTGKLVIARYGRNYRGYKAKYSEAAGAIGLIMYTDPGDSGWGRGVSYPEGGFANAAYIQRGSIKTVPYNGDVLTPGVEATKDAKRLDPREVGLPTIPVQPIGWGAAKEILKRMKGASVPRTWQGGLPFRYRLEGGSSVRVRVHVEQERRVVKTYNILGTLPGLIAPKQRIILGSHHDAWGFGAGDPTAGLITVMEAARVMSDAARAGHPPQRSLTFAAWGAEEHGIVGSVEWVEANLADLREHTLAYINLDMAAMGLRFGASASPSLQHCVVGMTRRITAPHTDGEPLLASWLQRSPHEVDPNMPRFGSLGGGSDHVGFIALAGVPCISMGAYGSPGTSYHSMYDNLAWYRQVVGDDYESARLVTRAATVTAARMANRPVVPVRVSWCGAEAYRHLVELTRIGRANGIFEPGTGDVTAELMRMASAAHHLKQRAERMQQSLDAAIGSGKLPLKTCKRINQLLLAVDRAWLDKAGLPGRPWFRNLYSAPDEHSGYSSWLLPVLRRAIDDRDAEALAQAEERYMRVFERIDRIVSEILELLPAQVDGLGT